MRGSIIFLAILAVPLLAPLALFVEFLNDQYEYSGQLVRLLLSLGRAVSADFALLSDISFSAMALIIVSVAPRPLPIPTFSLALVFCIVGYIANAFLGSELSGESTPFESSMHNRFISALDGYVQTGGVQKAVDELSATFTACRVFFAISFAAILGFKIKDVTLGSEN